MQCDQIWQNFVTLAKFYKSLANCRELINVWPNFKPTLAYFYVFGQLFNSVNGQIMKINLAIGPHCSHVQLIAGARTDISLGVNSIMSLAIISLALSLNLTIDLFIACWLLGPWQCGGGGRLTDFVYINKWDLCGLPRTMNDVYGSKRPSVSDCV